MKSYHYYPVAIIYEAEREPWYWSPTDSVLSIDEARKAIKTLFENNPDWKPVMTYIQKYSGNARWDVEKRYYVNALGLNKHASKWR